MKKISFIISIICSFSSVGQIAPELPEYKGNIDYVIQKRYGNVGATLVRPDGSQMVIGGSYKFTGQKTTMEFNPNGTLASKQVVLRKFPLMMESYSYDTLENKAIQLTTFGENSASNAGVTQRKEVILSSEKLPLSMSYSFEPALEDLNAIRSFDYDAQYDNGLLTSFKHTDINFSGDTIHKSIIEITRNSEGQITLMIERTDGIYSYHFINKEEQKKELITERSEESQTLKKWTYNYDKLGRFETQTIELTGDFRTEEEQAAITTFSYEYDKIGNWKVRYKKVGNGPKQIESKQKIKYRK